MGYPYFNPPYLQKVNKIEEGNFFAPSHGVELESVQDYHPEQLKAIKIMKLIALGVASAAMILLALSFQIWA